MDGALPGTTIVVEGGAYLERITTTVRCRLLADFGTAASARCYNLERL